MEAEVELFETQDGSHSLIAHRYGVSYHSKYGAIQESRHVFIESGLFPLALKGLPLHILEIGFGTGLNALLSLIESDRLQLPVHYEAVEPDPISLEQAALLNYPKLLGQGLFGSAFIEMHACPWNEEIQISPFFHFRKSQEKAESIDYNEEFDLIYFHPFTPDAQPELWELPVLEKMFRALKPKGILVTYSAKGEVKRRLNSLGFLVESLPGPPGKREMIRAEKL